MAQLRHQEAEMIITESILALEEQLKNLLEEVSEIKMQVYALEEKNKQAFNKVYDDREGQSHEHLTKLYEEGFHICPEHFAGVRDTNQDCLFCLSFLSEVRGNKNE